MAQYLLSEIGKYYLWGALGFLLGSILVLRNLGAERIPFNRAVMIWTLAIYAGLLGSRVLFVLESDPRLIVDDPALAFTFWQGGLSWQGGLPAGMLTLLVVLSLTKLPVWRLMGVMAPGLALSHSIARIACVQRGCCHGAPTQVPWAVHDEHLNAMVHPTAVYCMVGEALTALVLQTLVSRDSAKRYLFPLYLVLQGSHRFVTEAFRGTPAGPELMPGMRFYQSVSLILILIGLVIMAFFWRRRAGVLALAGACFALVLGLMNVQAAAPPRFTAPPSGIIAMEGGRTGTATATSSSTATEREQPIYLVMTRDSLAPGLDDWVNFRTEQGYDVRVVRWKDVPSVEEMRSAYGQLPCTPAYVLIAGDSAGTEVEATEPWHMPVAIGKFEFERTHRTYLCDADFCDPDGDSAPNSPVGRLPVRSSGELRRIAAKIMKYETQPRIAQEYQVVVWAGAYNMQSAIYSLSASLAEELPPWLALHFMSGRNDSAYAGHLPDQPEIFLQKLHEPAFLFFAACHGTPEALSAAAYAGRNVVLSTAGVRSLSGTRPNGPLIVLACDANRFDGETPSFGEVLAVNSTGPIGVISATGTVYPMTNYQATRALITELKQGTATVGAMLHALQRHIFQFKDRSFEEWAEGDALAQEIADISPGSVVQTVPGLLWHEARSYVLLGDPASPLRYPETFQVDASYLAALAGKSPGPDCLWVDVLPAGRLRDTNMSGKPVDERRDQFETVNASPHVLAQCVTAGTASEKLGALSSQILDGVIRVIDAESGKIAWLNVNPGNSTLSVAP